MHALTVHLTDVPLDNRDYGSVGAQTWGGACVLAEMIVEDPTRFGLFFHSQSKKALRVLELGAGTGLVSLTLGKLVESAPSSDIPQVTIISTDYYPSVLANLESNILTNFPVTCTADRVHISAHALDWSVFADTQERPPPFDEPFDLILGADIVYEVQHASWIKSCIAKLIRPPELGTGNPSPKFHLIVPLRSTHSLESSTVEFAFPNANEGNVSCTEIGEVQLGIINKETIVCDAGSGLGTEQIEYAYYVVGWV
jgi:predicted nicotinamide N-methyase